MKRTRSLLLLALVIILLPSCKKIVGKGDVITEHRNVTGFTAIDLAIAGDVYFTPDSVYHVEIQAQQNVADVIETYLSGNTLVLRLKDHTVLGKHDQIRFNISGPNVAEFNVSGSGTYRIQQAVDESTVKLGISGSGDIDANSFYSNVLDAAISGSGSMSAGSGTVSIGYLKISGSGNINMISVVFDTVYATISGSGDISAKVIKYLDGTISGSGSIHYDGSPVINSHVSGSGKITHI